jgi:hypothetical protein
LIGFDSDTEQVRYTPAHAEIQPGRGQHDIVRTRRNRSDYTEYDKRNEQFRFYEGLLVGLF